MNKSIGTNYIDFYVHDATYFYNFKAEHIPKEIKKFIGNRNISTNTFRI